MQHGFQEFQDAFNEKTKHNLEKNIKNIKRNALVSPKLFNYLVPKKNDFTEKAALLLPLSVSERV